jgi:hypothetical protein
MNAEAVYTADVSTSFFSIAGSSDSRCCLQALI